MKTSPNPRLERTRTSRFGCVKFLRQQRLVRAAHAGRWAITARFVTVCIVLWLSVGCNQSSNSSVATSHQPSVFEMRLTVGAASSEADDMILTNQLTKATEVLHVQKAPVVDGKVLSSASVQKVSGHPYPYIEIALNETGRDRLAEATRQNIGKRLAIVLDNQLLSAPEIRAEIKEGRAWIAGDFSEKEASEMAGKINSAIKR